MKIINRTENKLLVYYDTEGSEVPASVYLCSNTTLARALEKTPSDELGSVWTHVGWMPVDTANLSSEQINDILDPVWSMLTDIPTDTDHKIKEEFILEDFYIWPAGTLVLDIWVWFNKMYPEGLSRHF